MDRHFDELLGHLKHQLLRMSALAETMISAAIKAVVDRDVAGIAAVREHELQVDRLQVEIDEACLTLIALHQPAAGDLRFILGVAKTNAELERLADQAINICNKAEQLQGEVPLAPTAVLSRMGVIARGMLKDSLHAYVTRDVLLARAVLPRDDELDRLKAEMTVDVVGIMERDPAAVRRGVALILIARNVERIGDHATNIAENAIFVAEGTDVRHKAEVHPHGGHGG
jgi:phosphate transport system protein